MVIKFIRFSPEARIPQRSHESDTGADIYMSAPGAIAPGEIMRIPLGFGIDVPNGYTARMQVRTSVAMRGLHIEGCAIDAGYTGELSMILQNLTDKWITWIAGERLGYIEVYPCVYPTFKEEMKGVVRGDNAFGSTGK